MKFLMFFAVFCMAWMNVQSGTIKPNSQETKEDNCGNEVLELNRIINVPATGKLDKLIQNKPISTKKPIRNRMTIPNRPRFTSRPRYPVYPWGLLEPSPIVYGPGIFPRDSYYEVDHHDYDHDCCDNYHHHHRHHHQHHHHHPHSVIDIKTY